MDYVWRIFLAQSVATFGRNQEAQISVIDICAGTGLSIKRMADTLSHWGIKADIIGLDYSPGMLKVAKSRSLNYSDIGIKFVRGDAMDLAGKNRKDELVSLPSDSFDMATTMFGLGGIIDSLKVAQGVIQVLKPGGQWFFTDMHQPLAHQPGKWPFLFWAFESPCLEAMTYEETTIPLALKRLWR